MAPTPTLGVVQKLYHNITPSAPSLDVVQKHIYYEITASTPPLDVVQKLY